MNMIAHPKRGQYGYNLFNDFFHNTIYIDGVIIPGYNNGGIFSIREMKGFVNLHYPESSYYGVPLEC